MKISSVWLALGKNIHAFSKYSDANYFKPYKEAIRVIVVKFNMHIYLYKHSCMHMKPTFSSTLDTERNVAFAMCYILQKGKNLYNPR